MSLEIIVALRECVEAICEGIDAGSIQPTEAEMVAMAEIVDKYGGPLRLDLLCMLASRCEEGRTALKAMAQ